MLILLVVVALLLVPPATATPVCDEAALKRDAQALLSAHYDVELGAVAPGDAQHVGFQHLRGDGQLPHLVYGGSVPSSVEWLASNKTFHPGPAVLAPPVAADVAWQIFQLSPYETVLGVVGYQTNAVTFLCDAYEPLKKLQQLLLATRSGRNGSNDALLLASHHPWETFSSLSPHWISPLAALKTRKDYEDVVKAVPEPAKARFAEGASSLYGSQAALDDLFEPMVYLARCVSDALRAGAEESAAGPCGFQVFDTEFNSLALRSAHALVQIARVLLDHSSVCSEFKLSRQEMLADVSALRAVETRLKTGILGSGDGNLTAGGLWNATAQFFDDSAVRSPTAVHSLRGVMPAYAIAALPQHMAMGLAEHFLAPSEAFHFFCSRFPTPFFTCSPELGRSQVTVALYNYFVQRAFTNNAFPGIAEYVRNKTRDMVCEASGPAPAPASFALAYSSQDASPVGSFEDGFVGSTLAAAAFLNVLLPAVAAPPSPDAPPIDHRMLTVIMCIELVVAFLVALSCVFFSVYFVIKRPREGDPEAATDAGATATAKAKLGRVPSARKQPRGPDGGASGAVSSSSRRSRVRVESDPRSSVGDRSAYSEYSEQDDLEEPLLSDDEDSAYGSFEPAGGREQQPPQQPPPHGATSWSALKDALAAISPW
ncbi:hypothetical protein PybrP1_010155 [[Pythium] brassicae (nom. inval.)]|nr:hypothetical protein PybrP1_010155 [[Pythium] brassicae (nom. inval.)]